jgi:predicted lactoylglutathione lyase
MVAFYNWRAHQRQTAIRARRENVPKMIFLNLPVGDLDRSVAFYEGVGATKNPQFSNDKAACMVLSDTIFVMLLTHEFYRGFTSKPIADTHETSGALFCVSEDSREAVDATIERAAAAGGTADPGPTQDHGFMYGRSFEDPDGHHWEVMWMDVSQAPPTPDAA